MKNYKNMQINFKNELARNNVKYKIQEVFNGRR